MRFSVSQASTELRKLAASLRFARQARLLRHSGAFDGPWYRAAHPDSAGWDAALHFLAIGAGKGYRPHVLFDAEWWLEKRGSLRRQNVFLDYLTAPERWTIAPSPYFVVQPGLEPGRRSADISPLGFYHGSGGSAGLVRLALFDADFYARNNPDVVAAGLDPFLHFMANGGREGRSPCASFDAFRYLSVNPDVKARGDEPLRHFLMRGARQGRVPHRAIDPALLMAGSPSSDLVEALTDYEASGRHRLTALTHPRLPPPAAAAPLFDDWPWRNPTIPSARGRLLVLLDEPGTEAVEAILAIAANPSHPEPWLVALTPAAEAALEGLALPSLTLAGEAPEALRALLRAAALAGPHLSVAPLAAPGHPAHDLIAEQAGLPKVSLFSLPALPAVPAAEMSISVVVPCYNHAAFLDQRLASILAQRRKPCEVIIIDDASSDDSLARARAFADAAPLPVRVIARAANSGSPFTAWEEGVRAARGELLWIAESDDDADPRLLERLAPFLERDERVVLAYCQSAAIGRNGERLADDHLFYTDDIDSRRWEAPYVVAGEIEIEAALAIKNTIPNVSAVLFRRRALAAVTPTILTDRYCGDWHAYALLAACGWIGYSPEPLNRTRRHDENATLQGERNSLALREARDLRLSLWNRAGMSEATILAGHAQHQRELDLLCERHGLSDPADLAQLSMPTKLLRRLTASPAVS